MKLLCLSILLALCIATASAQAVGNRYDLNIPRQPLDAALKDFARQTGFQIARFTDAVPGGTPVGPLSGNYSLAQALEVILASSGLTYEMVNERTIAVVPKGGKSAAGAREAGNNSTSSVTRSAAEATRLAQAEAVPGSRSSNDDASSAKHDQREPEGIVSDIPEVLVIGSRTFNVDIQRTEDDPQPYVVYNSEEIKRSPATTVEEFLKTRLPMNAAQSNFGQASVGPRVTTPGFNASQIDLRGLGTTQTLILVDGRRMPGVSIRGGLLQPDLNGIPLSAIERIEVLPSTASGIYGGGATGGVVNVILKRNYTGLDVQVAYGDTFKGDLASRRLDLNAGISLEEGRTNISVAASHADAGRLLVGERDFAERSRALLLANNPAALTGPAGQIPPLGATVNIGNPFGTNLTLDPAFGGTDLGSNHTYIPLGYAGPASDNAAALIANAGQYNLDLPNDLNGRQGALITSPVIDSVSLNARRQFSEHIEAYLTLSSLHNAGKALTAGGPTSLNFLLPDAPNNPFAQPIFVSAPAPGIAFPARTSLETLQGVAGIIVRLPRNWAAMLDYNWSRSRFKATNKAIGVTDAFEVLQTGLPAPDGRPALNILQEGNTFPLDFSPYVLPDSHEGPTDTILKDAGLRLSGPVFDLPGGPLTLTTYLGRRAEMLETSFVQAVDPDTREPFYLWFPSVSQDANSAQLEFAVPLISSLNSLRYVRELQLQASVRRDEYEITGVPFGNRQIASPDGPFPDVQSATNDLESTDYTVALSFRPFQALTLRTSFGTGFLPPGIGQVASNIQQTVLFGAADPKRGNVFANTVTPYTRLTGGSVYLQPEQSASWSLGAILTPPALPGFRVSADYTRIKKTDEFGSVSRIFLLANEDNLPGRITRAPLTDADIALGHTGGVITQIDETLINIAATRVEAYDFQVDYTLETNRLGALRFYTVATWQPHFENRILPASPLIDYVGFADGPLEWRGNAGLTWQRGPWTLGWNTQYYDSYSVLFGEPFSALLSNEQNVLNQGAATIRSQTYHDFSAGYRFADSSAFVGGLLANTELLLSIQNVLDESPPILASASLFGGYSFYGDPRLRRFMLSVTKSFGRM